MIFQACVRPSVHLEYTGWLIEEGQKFRVQRIHPRVLEYGSLHFSVRRPASHLYITIAAGPIPPVAEKNKRSKGSMLHFQDFLLVCMPLFVLMPSVRGWERGVATLYVFFTPYCLDPGPA